MTKVWKEYKIMLTLMIIWNAARHQDPTEIWTPALQKSESELQIQDILPAIVGSWVLL